MEDRLLVRASGFARWRGRSYRCAIGRNGIAADKTEGDGTTPAGTWPLRRLLYRADRLAAPRTRLPAAVIARTDGWCDAPGDPLYNRMVTLPYGASAEELWRDDPLYDLVVPVGYNDDPPVSARGSAIFIHVAADCDAPTAGCVAFARSDLLELLAGFGPDTLLDIQP